MTRRGDDDAWNRRRRPTPKAAVDVADLVVVPAGAEAIIARLRDVEFVASCLPGIVPGSLAPAQNGTYGAEMRQTAIGVTATWTITIALDAPPTRRGVAVVLSGAEPRLHLTMTGTADVDVGADGDAGTPVDYRGHVVVEGRLAATGGPIIRRLVGEILDRFVVALAASGRASRATRASTALASGAPAVARSFRFHRPRGAMCGDGWCFQCKSDAGLACCTAAGGPAARRDRLRLLGRVAERYPPWFYERRMLRPRALRGRFLHTVRHLSAAPALDETAPSTPSEDLPPRNTPPPSSSATHRRRTARYGWAAQWARRSSVCTPSRWSASWTAHRCVRSQFERLIVAANERVRLPPIAGNDLPGVIAADALARYAAADGIAPGTRIAVWGPTTRSIGSASSRNATALVIAWSSPARRADPRPRQRHGRRRRP